MGRHVKNYVLGPTASYSVVVPSAPVLPNYPVDGQFRYNNYISTPALEFYSNGTWKRIPTIGNSVIVKDTGSGDGTTTIFAMTTSGLSYNSGQEAQVLVFIGGVFQNPGVNYTFNGTNNITFLSPVPFGQVWVVLHNFASNFVA